MSLPLGRLVASGTSHLCVLTSPWRGGALRTEWWAQKGVASSENARGPGGGAGHPSTLGFSLHAPEQPPSPTPPSQPLLFHE